MLFYVESGRPLALLESHHIVS